MIRKIARLHSPDIRQIDLDVNRTYRDHIMFRERYNSRQQDLFHVLAAYSMYNSEVRLYCNHAQYDMVVWNRLVTATE